MRKLTGGIRALGTIPGGIYIFFFGLRILCQTAPCSAAEANVFYSVTPSATVEKLLKDFSGLGAGQAEVLLARIKSTGRNGEVDEKKMLGLLKALHAKENVDVSANIEIFEESLGRTPDVALLKDLAEKGSLDANWALFYVCKQGAYGGDSADELAYKYAMNLLNLGDRNIAAYVADMLMKGRGVKKDVPKGMRMLLDALGRGDESAKVFATHLYDKGGLLPESKEMRDFIESLK